MPPATINFFRWLLPFVILFLWSWKEIREQAGVFLAKWPLILFLGATGYCFNSIGVYEAVRFSTAINASVINAFNPALIALTAYVLNHERVSRKELFGFILSLIGVLWIIFKGNLSQAMRLRVNVGDLSMVMSMTIFSIHTVIYKKKSSGFSERPMFALMMSGGLLLTFPLAFLESRAAHWSSLSTVGTVDVIAILCLNIFPSLLAYQFWNRAIKKVSANRAAAFLYLIPVYTSIISILFLGEKLRTFQIIGGLLIFIGVLLVTHVRNKDL